MNAELLKKALLQWAIEGKLVPQSDDEEGVGNIGGIPENIPFAIPKKWKWAKLGQVFALKAGKFISSSEIKASGEYPCYGGNGVRGFLDRYNREGRFPLIGRQGALCGNINLADGKFYATEHAVVADGGDRIDPDCAAFFLTALNLNQYATHTAQPGLSVKRISETPFPVPPFKEQLRISQKLNEILPLVEAYGKEQEALLKLERELPAKLRTSILQEAIQGKLVPQCDEEPVVAQIGEAPEEVPFAIPEKWKWIRIENLADVNPRVKPNSESDEVSFLPMASVEAGYKNRANLSETRVWSSVKGGYTKFADQDILLAKITPCFQNRKSVIVEGLTNGLGCGSSEFHVLRARDVIDSRYLLFFLKTDLFIQYGVEHFKGTAGQQRLGAKDLKDCFVPLPPLEEQKRIVNMVDILLSEVDRIGN